MKQFIIILAICLLVANCKNEPKDYVTLSGKIENSQKDKTLVVFKGKAYKKEIKLNDDGSFKDTLKVEGGTYFFQHADQYGKLFIENGNTVELHTDYNNFDNTLVFDGDNKDKSTFFVKRILMEEEILTSEVMDLPEAEFKKTMSTLNDAYTKLKSEFKDIDTLFFQEQDKDVEKMITAYTSFFNSKLEMQKALPAGTPSPTFINYENHKGGTTSLKDLKGKYVYIDVWATWCGPCIAEIPSLKEIEQKYHDKNIAFVSISIDKESAYEKWKKMVVEKELGGIQLLADNDWKSQFVQDYKINGIPRFILIDPNGNIINPDAPRPSSPKLVEVFDNLTI